MTKKASKYKAWRPDRPTSTGASAYHDAVINASWHSENISGLTDLMHTKVKEGDVVVDFGAGTGASTVYFIRNLKKHYILLLVDNSPSWMGKAYEVLKTSKNVDFYLLEKNEKGYSTLDKTIGAVAANHIVCANTVHLIPNIKSVFKGIYKALKPEGTFMFQSGNIKRKGRKTGILMIDDTIKKVHDRAIKIIQENNEFVRYRKNLIDKIKLSEPQRKLVFPDPRPIEYYLQMVKSTGFVGAEATYKQIQVKYSDWLIFLRVKRLQAGILPEVGGKECPTDVEKDRDKLISMASIDIFKELEAKNPFANKTSFTAEWVYVQTKK